jgi:phosphoadenosine phosphosulfate reductase
MNPDRVFEAEQAIAEALAEGGAACVTSSFQAECMVLVHMTTRRQPEMPVLFLDTGYHFRETYEYRDAMTARYGLNLVDLVPRQTVAEQTVQFGVLYRDAPDRCCKLRKVEPLFDALAGYDVWFTALRREQSPTRANLQVRDRFPLPGNRVIGKISPLAGWTAKDVWEYLRAHEIPLLPLYERGYSSIGCEPCTTLPLDPENPRSGRWAGHKLECGIHVR